MQENVWGLQVEEFQWIEKIPSAVFVYRATDDGQIIYANKALLSLFECKDMDEFIACKGGSCFSNLVYSEDYQRMEVEIVEQLQENTEAFDRIEYRIQTKSGKIRLVEDFGYRIDDPKYGPLFYVQVVDAGQVAKYAMDELTGLPGMQRFLKYLGRRLDEIDENYEPRSLKIIFFNICNFKRYNYNFGKQEGDEVLIDCAKILKRSFPDGYLSRFTGDHFVLLTKSEVVASQIDNAYALFSEQYEIFNMKLKAGVYEIMDNTKSALIICDLAAAACDNIKNSNQYIKVYDQRLNRKIEISNYVVKSIDRAIKERDIKVFYQPVVRAESKKLCGLEALARWDDKEYGLLSPAYFIEALEENRQIHKLDLYVIRETCRQIQECIQNGQSIVPVSFNLSRLDFALCDIFEQVESITKEYHISRDMINIEITESMVIDNPDVLKKEIEKFRSVGYQVWMDDFGSGYSSLNILKDILLDEIKLDMEFLSSFTDTSKNIITSMIEMSKRIGIRTLAEGVETKEQYEFLKNIGCEKVQGYFFGKPMPFTETMAYCEANDLGLESIA